MKFFRCRNILGLSALLMGASNAWAQQPSASMHIGYVYPAGGQRGTTFEVVVGGQFLAGLTNVYVTGGGVQAAITDLIRPISGGELNALRIKVDQLLARRAVVKNDFKALEQFRSFKNAKDLKKDSAEGDKEMEELKKKYAGATWTAEDEKMLADARRKIASGVRRPANPAISEIATIRLTIAADAEVGQRELRVATMNGLSNPLVFQIGQLPEFSIEAHKAIAEQKSAIAKTAFLLKNTAKVDTTFTIPAVVNGQILPGGVNHHHFAAKKGQRLVIAVSARALIPYLADAVPGWFQATLALYDSNGNEVAYSDDFRFNPDPVLYYEIPADGEYAIEIKDSIYRGREDFVYRITVGEVPFITSIFPLGGPANADTTVQLKGWNLPTDKIVLDDKNKTPGIYPIVVRKGDWVSNIMPFAVDTLPECYDKEPNNLINRAQRITLPIIINGRIDSPNDVDAFRFEGKAGQEIVAEVMARRLNSPLDSILALTDANGKQIACNDDYADRGAGLETHHADSYIRTTLPADGTYYLFLRDTQSQGGPEYAYRLRVSAPRPDFDLRIVPSSLVARGGGAPASVYILRRDGFEGPVSLSLKDAPPGYRLSNNTIPASTNFIRFTISVPFESKKEPRELHIEGRAAIDGNEVVHPAAPADDMMQAFEYRHLVTSQELELAIASGGRFSYKTDGGKTAFQIVSTIASSMKVDNTVPVKIPIGGIAKIPVTMASVPSFAKVSFELNDPPPGIIIKNFLPTKTGMVISVGCDAKKVKPGQTGKLAVASYIKRVSGPEKNTAGQPARLPLTTFPAIPFEIVPE
jgi:hypothetical protein